MTIVPKYTLNSGKSISFLVNDKNYEDNVATHRLQGKIMS